MTNFWLRLEDVLWRVLKQVVFAFVSILAFGIAGITGIVSYEIYKETSGKTALKQYLADEYPAGTNIEIKRGYYAGCEGEVVGLIDFQAQVELVDCKGDEKNLVVLHTKYFDEKSYDFALEHPFFLSEILD